MPSAASSSPPAAQRRRPGLGRLAGRLAAALVLALGVGLALPHPASALVQITLSEGQVEPLPIAIPDFTGSPLAKQVSDVVAADLRNSGLFRPLDPASFIDKTVSVSAMPNFDNWRVVQAQALVVGAVQESGGQLVAQVRLWDVFASEQMLGQQFSTPPENWRRLAHKIADAIYQRITGESGYFDSRVVFVDETGPKNKRVKRLAIMDYDGANARALTKGNELVLTPRFSPTSQQVTYMSFADNNPRVYLLDLASGTRKVVGNFPGMTFAPRFSPDGSRIVFSMQEGGNSNIYVMGINGGGVTKLTDSPAIDTSPSYSPDGSQIVFESDRGGTQQLYVMGAGGGGASRISFGAGRYSTPVWSPRGDYIAFTKQEGGAFSIGVMKPDGSGERILSRSFHNEGPTWAPNGRVLMFFREGGGPNGGPQLFSVDVTGHNEMRVPTPSFGSDPAWSPLLP